MVAESSGEIASQKSLIMHHWWSVSNDMTFLFKSHLNWSSGGESDKEEDEVDEPSGFFSL